MLQGHVKYANACATNADNLIMDGHWSQFHKNRTWCISPQAQVCRRMQTSCTLNLKVIYMHCSVRLEY